LNLFGNIILPTHLRDDPKLIITHSENNFYIFQYIPIPLIMSLSS
jgi:hypothetical protein